MSMKNGVKTVYSTMSYSIHNSIHNASKLANIRLSKLATEESIDSSNSIPVVLLTDSPSSKKSSESSSQQLSSSYPSLKKNNNTSKYIGTISMLRYYIELNDSTNDEDEKMNICTILYETLVRDPTILIYEPEFRKVVLSKMDDMDKVITLRRLNLVKSPFKKYTNELNNIITNHIRSSKVRNIMLNRLNELNSIFIDYTSWARLNKFRITMNSLRKTIDDLKSYPDYVA